MLLCCNLQMKQLLNNAFTPIYQTEPIEEQVFKSGRNSTMQDKINL